MREFINTEKTGSIYIDRILFEASYPVLFTCKNKNGEYFVVVCCQHNSEGIKWLVRKNTATNIIKMLRDEITIRDALLKGTSDKISVSYKDGKYSIEIDNEDWNEKSSYLPKKDSYIDAEPGEFDEDIQYFIQSDVLPYTLNDEYKNIMSKTEIIEGNTKISFATENTDEDVEFGEIVVSSEIIKTYRVKDVFELTTHQKDDYSLRCQRENYHSYKSKELCSINVALNADTTSKRAEAA